MTLALAGLGRLPESLTHMSAVGADHAALAADRVDITAALQGDGDAYGRLVERHQDALARQMRRFSRDPQLLDELVHDTFVEAYLSLRNYRGEVPWSHWVSRIGVRVGYRLWTRQSRSKRVESLSAAHEAQLASADPGAIDALAAAEWIEHHLARLAPRDRLILTLLYLEGLTLTEAAYRASWTLVGTRVQAFRARRKLRQLLESAP